MSSRLHTLRVAGSPSTYDETGVRGWSITTDRDNHFVVVTGVGDRVDVVKFKMHRSTLYYIHVDHIMGTGDLREMIEFNMEQGQHIKGRLMDSEYMLRMSQLFGDDLERYVAERSEAVEEREAWRDSGNQTERNGCAALRHDYWLAVADQLGACSAAASELGENSLANAACLASFRAVEALNEADECRGR